MPCSGLRGHLHTLDIHLHNAYTLKLATKILKLKEGKKTESNPRICGQLTQNEEGGGSHLGGTDSQSLSLFSVHFRALGRSEDHEKTRLCKVFLAAFCLTSSLFPHHVAMYPPVSYSLTPERCSLTCSLRCFLIRWTRFQCIGVSAIYFLYIFASVPEF